MLNLGGEATVISNRHVLLNLEVINALLKQTDLRVFLCVRRPPEGKAYIISSWSHAGRAV